ncbi:hypothetical protein MLD38_028398 [Melastoma candidum]|uniref:Uncharacterized protein n=1 Tax=Melastoma candidum TaxID=119954 RepID=A0ACB9N5B0_9MYRT|nr:hypothetical protein MLD38_028398 [Melastoma candidum]
MPPLTPPLRPSLLLLILVSSLPTSRGSLPPPPSRPCPPFSSSSPPPYPFSTTPGLGHPSFPLVTCSSPHSTFSIDSLPFSLLRFLPNSSSLLLSPSSTANSSSSCPSSAYVPSRPISLSGSPFRVSDSTCSRLASLRPCRSSLSLNCTLCPWHCGLFRDPLSLLPSCPQLYRRHRPNDRGCQSDVLDYLGNMLSNFGIEVEWETGQDPYFTQCRACQSNHNGSVCGFDDASPNKSFVCLPLEPHRVSSTIVRPGPPDRIATLGFLVAFLACFLLMVSAAAVTIFRRWSGKDEEDPTAAFLQRHGNMSPLPPVFTYEELEASTNGFDPKRKIGDGGFGSVYLGRLCDGRAVAVKHLHSHRACAISTKSFCNEILILSSIRHLNLVRLHGYCSDPRGLVLVYDYVPNGTLADHLHGPRSIFTKRLLTWRVRVEIALEIGMALEYLHFAVKPPIVHRDITSCNIFLETDMRVRVGDFGLSRVLVTAATNSDEKHVWTGPQGTPGYLDPDYHRSFRLTEKSDVYSYGVVLMELVTGMRAVDRRRGEGREVALADVVVRSIHMGLLEEVVDPDIAVEAGVNPVAELAFRCVAAEKDDRPDMSEVVAELRRIRASTCPHGAGSAVLQADMANV